VDDCDMVLELCYRTPMSATSSDANAAVKKTFARQFHGGCLSGWLVSCPDPTHVRVRGSGYTSPNPWAHFRI